MKKHPIYAFCIHGHFYQPPREDPITGQIPVEPGAAPYPNWNERINAQSYQPNADLKNFEGISFDLGPTLVTWLAQADPDTLEQIIEQDRMNVRRYGVGNAMAQAYNHTILPLAPTIDKQTQIIWGIEDFKYRFSHHPSGMWLPETAVDLETLDILAQNDIQFTILAPWQADRASLDVSRPYWIECFDGRKIIAFFYHQDLSTRVSFDPGATANADQFAHKILLPQFDVSEQKIDQDQMLLIASDGEAYGHHHPFRDKFLSYLLTSAAKEYSITKTFPALWLKTHAPIEKIEIRENTSWSCHHGVKRWSEECGCTAHGEWKAPLRGGLDQIAEAIDREYFNFVIPYLSDPWELRHQYIHVINQQISAEELILSQVRQTPGEDIIFKISILLSAQFERQRMFTSCGWFFDYFDRIEPQNNVKYTAQAVWLTKIATGVDLSKMACENLEIIKSWRSGLSAETVFMRHIQRLEESPEEILSEYLVNRMRNSFNR